MKKILLLRHAEAAQSAPEDRARQLTSRGRIDSQMIARKMKSFKLMPDYVLCSPARRARETFDCMEKILPCVSVIYPEYLYNASTEDLFKSLRKITNTSNVALVVGHNPGIHTLATQLAGKGDHERLASMAYGFKPGTMAVIEFGGDSWGKLNLGENKLVQLVTPS